MPDDIPAWARADPLIVYLMAYGLTLDEAFEKAERAAAVADLQGLPPPLVQVVYGEHELRLAIRAWNPALGPPPIRGYGGDDKPQR